MSGVVSCKQCGCSEIDSDPARGDSVCTSCGYVLEESIIVSEVTFEEDGHGGSNAVGQFVASDVRGGGGLSGVSSSGFHSGVGKESREITLRNAKKRITDVAVQLRLNQHCMDVAFNFFKMALHKQLTKGRKHSLTVAACIYMTCRIEGTPHLLIDFSDVLQMDVYALGRAYVQISRALYINIPAVDPCMYILRFAHKFELGDKTHDVAMTALRLVQRMKRDWIHFGRRPSGLCGAALLISARLHNFSRSVQDVIKVVKVHETTLRKRLVEFGETPSSSLTLDEFMSVDLEEEHDPPSFKAARIRDRERLQKLLDTEVGKEFKDIQGKIEMELEKRRRKVLCKGGSGASTPTRMDSDEAFLSPVKEKDDEKRFILESTLSTINTLISTNSDSRSPISISHSPSPVEFSRSSSSTPVNFEKQHTSILDPDRILMPPPRPTSACVTAADLDTDDELSETASENLELVSLSENGELDLDGIDDDEIDGYIMNTLEVKKKTVLWEQINSDYIIQQKLKQEQLEKDILEGKVDTKKKKRSAKAKPTFQAKSANEAIKIMLKERKMSSKINYDVLRSLTSAVDLNEEGASTSASSSTITEPVTVIESGPIIPPLKRKLEEPCGTPSVKKIKASKSKKKSQSNTPVPADTETEDSNPQGKSHETDEETGDEAEVPPFEESSQLLRGHRKVETPEEIVEDLPSETEETAETVVESGGVHYVDDEEDEIDEDEEEEDSFSARRLLTQFRGDGDEENEYDEYYD